MSSPTQRSLVALRNLGYVAAVVERFIRFSGPHGTRHDLFGLADVEAINATETLYVQCCPASTLAKHCQKHLQEPRLRVLLACPTRHFEVWSWGKRGARGKRKLWTLRRHRAEINLFGIVKFFEIMVPSAVKNRGGQAGKGAVD